MEPVRISDIESHFRLCLDAVVARILVNLSSEAQRNEQIAQTLETFAFLRDYEATLNVSDNDLRSEWADHLMAQAERFQEACSTRLPLHTLSQTISPVYGEIEVLLAVGLVEEDLRFGSLFAALQRPLKSRNPCIGLLTWLLSAPHLDVWMAGRRLSHEGFVSLDQKGEVRGEWVMRVPPLIWDAIRGQWHEKPAPGIVCHPSESFPPIDELILPPDQYEYVQRLPAVLSETQAKTLVVRGMNSSGRRTVIGSVARQMGLDVLVCQDLNDETKAILGPLATLSGALPILRCEAAPGERINLNSLPGYIGPVGITIGRSGGLYGELLNQAVNLRLPAPTYPLRQYFWDTADVPIASDSYATILKRFQLAGGIIHRAAQLGLSYAHLNGREALTADDVQQALRTLNLQALETLATPLDAVSGWGMLIANDNLIGQLQMLEVRCRERETLQDFAGQAFEDNLNRGVRAMFSGPSGTGKTLAARVLASVLQMDIFRVDLAAVVNKYIGETERNLNEVFSRAEELDVVLLLDEGDSLMTQRTNVSNANDRYANLETNYLLQRLENYEGIVIITTNAASRIDQAFMRRLDMIIEFALPEADERRALWSLHLPEDHIVSAGLMETVVQRCRLSGGQIRNTTLYALLLAIRDNASITDTHFQSALQYEYRRSGAVYPLDEPKTTTRRIDRLRRYSQQLDQ